MHAKTTTPAGKRTGRPQHYLFHTLLVLELCVSCWVHSVLYVSPEIYIFLFIQMQEFEKWLYQNPEIMDNVFGWQCPSPEGEIIN